MGPFVLDAAIVPAVKTICTHFLILIARHYGRLLVEIMDLSDVYVYVTFTCTMHVVCTMYIQE